LLLIDTQQEDAYKYQVFSDIAKSIGFEISYLPIAKIVDQTLSNEELKNLDAIFFLFSGEYLSAKQSEIPTKILDILHRFSQEENKLIGLLLPPQLRNPQKLLPVLEQIGLSESNIRQKRKQRRKNLSLRNLKNLDAFTILLQRYISTPLQYRTTTFHTTLSPPMKKRKFGIKIKNAKYNNLELLPIKTQKKDKTLTLMPYGIYWYNPINKNHIFVGSTTSLTFAGICESFRICPTNYIYRKALLENLQETFWELKQLTASHNMKQKLFLKHLKNNTKPQLPASFDYLNQEKQHKTKPTKIAWMEINIFGKQKEKNKQNSLIEYVYASELDYLWISISPNMYYSPIAKLANKKDDLLKTISNFTQKLKTKSEKLKTKPPKILVGIEIANNLYKPNLPKLTAKDLYGENYFDIPSPLNKDFWNNEIIQPVKLLVEDWNKQKISNGIKIDGIIIDLEMYCRKTVGSFLSTMGFNPQVRKQYVFTKIKNKKRRKKVDTLSYLLENKDLQNYFAFLRHNAINLGRKIRKSFDKDIPNCTIGCYAPNISTNWFYKGFYQGLCYQKTNKPLLLLTFNNEFEIHKPWFRHNNINAKHASVLMLSKIKSKKDFYRANIGNIWLNRFSRFIDKYNKKEWYANEQSPIQKKKKVLEFLDYVKKM